jgi:hypothetical protein
MNILDHRFVYHPAKSHDGSADAFRKRQEERLAQAQAIAAEAKAKTTALPRKGKAA